MAPFSIRPPNPPRPSPLRFSISAELSVSPPESIDENANPTSLAVQKPIAAPGTLIGVSPPSALAEIKSGIKLYEKTKGKEHLKQICAVVDYVKMYRKITTGMDKKTRKTTISNNKWADDIFDLYTHDFVFSTTPLKLEDAEHIKQEITSAWGGNDTPTIYPHMTASHIQTLKSALLLTGKNLEYSWHRVFITLGTYYVANRTEHAITTVPSIEVTPANANVSPGCALPPTIAATLAKTRKTNGPNFGSPTAMQLAILDTAYAQNHSVTQTDTFKSATKLMKCYMAQGAGITANPSVTTRNGDPPSSSASTLVTSPSSMPPKENEQLDENAALAKLANTTLSIASIASHTPPSSIDEMLVYIETNLADLGIHLGNEKSILRRVIAASIEHDRIDKIKRDRGRVKEQDDENSTSEEEFPMRRGAIPAVAQPRGVQLFDGPDPFEPEPSPPVRRHATNMSLDSIMDRISLDAASEAGSISSDAGSVGSLSGWAKRASKIISQSDKDKAREQRREKRAMAEDE